MNYRQSVLLLSVLFFASAASAHDLWLIPPDKATLKQPVVVHANVGMDFPTSVFAPDTERYPRKFVMQPDGKTLPLKSAGKKDLSSLLEFTPTTPV